MTKEQILKLAEKKRLTKKEIAAIDDAMMVLDPHEALTVIKTLATPDLDETVVPVCDRQTARDLMAHWAIVPNKVGGKIMACFFQGGKGGMFSGIAPKYVPDTLKDLEDIWKCNKGTKL